MHVPPRFGAGPQAAHARGTASGDVAELQATFGLPGRGPRSAGPLEDAGARSEGYAVLHEGIRPKYRR